jgi:DNA-binding transcriptional MerR regulator
MDKSPDAFRTISEVADEMDLPQHVLRFWETRFPQIKPLKRGGGRRYYRPDDIELLRAIKELLYDQGLTIKGVQKQLRDKGVPGVVRSVAHSASERAPPSAEMTQEEREGSRADGEADGGVEAASALIEPTLAPGAASASRDSPAIDLSALRVIQAELREAERILAQARAV